LLIEGRKGVNMFAELLLIGKLLDPLSKRSTPKAVSPTPAKVHTKDSQATLGGGTLNLLHPRAPVTLRPDQIPERYYRRPKGLD